LHFEVYQPSAPPQKTSRLSRFRAAQRSKVRSALAFLTSPMFFKKKNPL
jgi:hypothetical protein